MPQAISAAARRTISGTAIPTATGTILLEADAVGELASDADEMPVVLDPVRTPAAVRLANVTCPTFMIAPLLLL